MSETEVISAVGAQHLKQMPRQKYQGMYAKLMIPVVDIGHFPFDIFFQMDDSSDRFSQVLLAHHGDPKSGCDKALAAARKALGERFGSGERIGTSESWTWKFPTTTIELSMLEIEDIVADVHVRFFPTDANRVANQISAF